MWSIIRVITINAIFAGVSLFLGLPQKVSTMLDFVLSDMQVFGAALVIGGIPAWIIVYLFENKFSLHTPDLSFKYIFLKEATQKLRNEKLKQGNTLIEAVDEMDVFKGNTTSTQYYAEHALGDSPVWGRRRDSKIWERIDDRKNTHQLRVTQDGKSLMRDDQVIYPDAKMLKSDYKK